MARSGNDRAADIIMLIYRWNGRLSAIRALRASGCRSNGSPLAVMCAGGTVARPGMSKLDKEFA